MKNPIWRPPHLFPKWVAKETSPTTCSSKNSFHLQQQNQQTSTKKPTKSHIKGADLLEEPPQLPPEFATQRPAERIAPHQRWPWGREMAGILLQKIKSLEVETPSL